jgi:succinate-acetate transporter protein
VDEPFSGPFGGAAGGHRNGAPAILGLLGFAGATFMVASNLAGWWGNAVVTPLELAPFAATFGGLAQFLAGMWAYRARDGLGTAMHGTWGAFWLAYGLVAAGVATGRLPLATMASRAFGFWFIVLCVVTFFGTVAASRVSLALVVVLGLLTVGSGLLAAGLVGDSIDVVRAAGWVLVASAVAAFYTAGAMLLRDTWGGRAVLPVGERNAARQTW